MLYLIGLGINGLLPQNIISEIKNFEIYLEDYTSFLPEDWKFPLKYKKINREKVESDFLIEEAKSKNIALLIIGDPLSATTHFILYEEAIKNNIKVKVYHNSSIFSAISSTGLHLYKFGKTATIPKWRENYKPTSFYNVVLQNLSINAHTLLLLDIDNGKQMSIKDAIKELIEVDNKNLIDKVVIISRLGWKDEKILYGKVKELLKIDLGNPPFSIIVPAKLHFTEEDALKLFSL